jgi:PASTA domain
VARLSTIRYGNLSAEIVSGQGVRLTRLTLRQADPDFLRAGRPGAPPGPQVFGREQELADALDAIGQGRSIEFHAPCGYGKTALLDRVLALASERYGASSCLYLRADRDRVGDLLQDLTAELYRSDQRVKLTPAQCARLLGPVSAVIAIDDLSAGPEQVSYLLGVLSGCTVVAGSARPVLGPVGSSQRLAGLPAEAALSLLAHDLRRPLTSEEVPAARELAAAVDGQPLHLKQAAALVRDGSHSLTSLARQAAADAGVLDRLSVDGLTGRERRALAVLALTAGALLPAGIVDVIGQLAGLSASLTALRRRGLAEQRHDRFGLPVCKAASYRDMLLDDLHLGSSARELCGWLATRDPADGQSLSAAEAALAIMEFAAERRQWTTVVLLARAAEPVLFIAGHWDAWHHALGQGLAAARAAQDTAAVALFSHQLGSRALCLDRLHEAQQLLRAALTLREQAADHDGAELTRHNLRLLEPPDLTPPRPPDDESHPPRRSRRRRGGRPVTLVLASVLGLLVIAAGAVAATGVLRGGPGLSRSSSPPPLSGSSPVSGPPDRVTVPDVLGLAQAQAASKLQGQDLTAVTVSTGSCGTAGDGDVATQNPEPGTSVSPDSDVTLGICAATAAVIVDNVIGDGEDQAATTLDGQGLGVTTASTSSCGTVGDGDVVTQDPSPGASVSPGTDVTLNVCDASPAAVLVQNVVGESQAQATSTLEAQGLTVSATNDASCGGGQHGDVLTQNPGPGASVSPGTSVTIAICLPAQ